MSILDKFISDNSRFVKLQSGKSMVADLLDYQETADMNGNPCIAYDIIIEGEEKERVFRSGSVGLANQIVQLPDEGKGHRIKVSRQGEGLQTRYTVELWEKDIEAV